ncbi:hypothetical protein ACUR5C_02490 [Aliikangiella sp. IMCC44653]
MTTKRQVQLVAYLEKDLISAIDLGEQDMRETLMAGLTWQTYYWVDCALEWIEQGFEIDSDIVEVLERISDKRVYPQATRHKAFKNARRWHKSINT